MLACHTASPGAHNFGCAQFFCKKFHRSFLCFVLPIAYLFPRSHMDHWLPLLAHHATLMDVIGQVSFKNFHPSNKPRCRELCVPYCVEGLWGFSWVGIGGDLARGNGGGGGGGVGGLVQCRAVPRVGAWGGSRPCVTGCAPH